MSRWNSLSAKTSSITTKVPKGYVELSEQEYRYKLADNDLDIIKHYTKEPLSDQARKSLIILSEVFGGLHNLEAYQLKLFDYQSTFYNQYLLRSSLATFDSQQLTLLVIMAHDMAVRVEIKASKLDPEDEYFDKKLLANQVSEYTSEYNLNMSIDEFANQISPYLRILFHARERNRSEERRVGKEC